MWISETVILNQHVTRSIAPNYKNTSFGVMLHKMKSRIDAITKAFAEVHGSDTTNLTSILTKFFADPGVYFGNQPVHWFWSEFYRTIQREHTLNPKRRFNINIKACREYYFYKLTGSITSKRARGTNRNIDWELLHDPFFRKASPPGKNDKNLEEDIRGITDTLLFLAPIFSGATKQMADYLGWFDLSLEIKVTKWSEKQKKLSFEVSPHIAKTKHLTMPPDQRPILVGSPNVREAIKGLADVWLNPEANTVLLSAAPGSGKEVLEKLLVSALRLGKDQVIEVSAPELVNFGALTKRIEDPIRALSNAADGKNKRLMLFLDEIHHGAASDLRSGLLRMMEAGSFTDSKDKRLACDQILYVFAASKPVQELRKLKPPDLWTRIEHTIELKHPLQIDSTSLKREEVIADYFFLFWTGKCKSISIYPSNQNEAIDTKILMSEQFVDKLAVRFAGQFGSPLIPLISIRILRSIIKRLKSRTAFYLRRHPLIINVQDVPENMFEQFDMWLYSIFNELVPELQRDGLF